MILTSQISPHMASYLLHLLLGLESPIDDAGLESPIDDTLRILKWLVGLATGSGLGASDGRVSKAVLALSNLTKQNKIP